MKKTAMIVLVLILSASVSLAQERGKDFVYKDVQALSGDYVYRTDEIVSPPTGKKTLWDYLSFFALPKSRDKGEQHIAAQEAKEFKLRIRELAEQLLQDSQRVSK